MTFNAKNNNNGQTVEVSVRRIGGGRSSVCIYKTPYTQEDIIRGLQPYSSSILPFDGSDEEMQTVIMKRYELKA